MQTYELILIRVLADKDDHRYMELTDGFIEALDAWLDRMRPTLSRQGVLLERVQVYGGGYGLTAEAERELSQMKGI